MELLRILNEKLWNPDFWLPQNISWEEINKYTQFNGAHIVLVTCSIAIGFYVVRVLFEKFIANPIGAYMRVPEKNIFVPNAILESYYLKNRIISESIAMMISKDTGLTVDFIQKWFSTRKDLNRPSKRQKFNETFWRFVFYLFIWILGYYILHDKPWFSDTNECWRNYPKQHVDIDIYYYYMIEMGFYVSLLATQFFDIRRKDFWQMFLHHIVTLSLLLFSYVCNYMRIGSLVLLLHDTADSSLELAKLLNYANVKKLCDPIFGFFTLNWLVTRLYLYPTKILNSTTYEIHDHIDPFPSLTLFNILLYSLQVMHFIWFYMILRTIYKVFCLGISEDERSDIGSEDMHEHKE